MTRSGSKQSTTYPVIDHRFAVACAVSVTLGALIAVPIAWQWCAIGAMASWRWNRRAIAVVCVGCCAAGLAAQALAGLAVTPGPIDDHVTVVRDPVVRAGSLTVEVRGTLGHLDLVASTQSETLIAQLQAGDRLHVVGVVKPTDPGNGFARWRHVAGKVQVTRVVRVGQPRAHWRIANALRGVVHQLGRRLPSSQQALFNGFVLGDASGQSAQTQADFKGSGLTHLLVASGANVAFLCALAGPLLRRCGLRTRWLATGVLLVGFVFITRAEPSVLRAAMMAAIVTTGATVGRVTPSLRSMALAVTVLILADPFLVHSVGFQLSVGASLGVILLSRPLLALFGGGGWAREAFAVTVAAQIGVSPVLLVAFNDMPVAALPANVLAAPAAGAVMTIGLVCLVFAAMPLPGAALAVWVPRVLLGWIQLVARSMAALPLGFFTSAMVAAALLCVVGAQLAAHFSSATWRRVMLGAASLCCVVPAVVLALGTSPRDPGDGVHVVTTARATVVVLTRGVETQQILAAMARTPVRRIDALVLPHGDRADARALDALEHRYRVGHILLPSWGRVRDTPGAHHALWSRPNAAVVTQGQRLRVGDIALVVILDRPLLSVSATSITQSEHGG